LTRGVQRRDLRDGLIVALVVAGLAALLVAGLVGAHGRGAGKELTGTKQADSLVGTNGPDHIRGRGGNDRIRGRGGADTLNGGSGRDRISGGPGADVLVGGKGRDLIMARDGHLDQINCGPGRHDVAVVDRAEDGVFDCERVRVPRSGQKRDG
jgi:Ca2+-binding RTX toxin-like protein